MFVCFCFDDSLQIEQEVKISPHASSTTDGYVLETLGSQIVVSSDETLVRDKFVADGEISVDLPHDSRYGRLSKMPIDIENDSSARCYTPTQERRVNSSAFLLDFVRQSETDLGISHVAPFEPSNHRADMLRAILRC